MKSVKLFFTSLVILLAAITGYAQDIQVKGVVSDASTGETIPFATVQVKGTTKIATTDLNGSYTILAPGNATLLVTYVGYADAEVPVNGRSVVNIAKSITLPIRNVLMHLRLLALFPLDILAVWNLQTSADYNYPSCLLHISLLLEQYIRY